jgi:hypothetical protein
MGCRDERAGRFPHQPQRTDITGRQHGIIGADAAGMVVGPHVPGLYVDTERVRRL